MTIVAGGSELRYRAPEMNGFEALIALRRLFCVKAAVHVDDAGAPYQLSRLNTAQRSGRNSPRRRWRLAIQNWALSDIAGGLCVDETISVAGTDGR
jgi:hypothetical protein